MCIIFGPIFSYRKKAMIVMTLVIFNFLIFFITFFGNYFDPENGVILNDIYMNFSFSPNYLVGQNSYIAQFDGFKPLTIFTHMFLHSGFLHILSNMIFLLFLGIPFEEKIGPWVFLIIYFIAGIFGSIFTSIFSIMSDGQIAMGPSDIGVGASGAIFGILGAFIATYPNERILFPLILIRKWPVWLIAGIYFGIETLIAASNPEDNIGHFAHIGGFIGGLFFIPVIKKFETTRDTTRKLDTLDFDALEKFATDYKLKDMLEKVRNEDEADVREVWLEEFLKNIKCPECGKKLKVKSHMAKCSCGFKIRY